MDGIDDGAEVKEDDDKVEDSDDLGVLTAPVEVKLAEAKVGPFSSGEPLIMVSSWPMNYYTTICTCPEVKEFVLPM